jgi:hypothetical protein
VATAAKSSGKPATDKTHQQATKPTNSGADKK